MKPEIQRKWIVRFALPVIVGLFYFSASSHFDYTPDDTFIYLQYAKNLSIGNGFSFNVGEPSYGFTSPLWVFLIAVGGLIGGELYTIAKALDLFLAGCALIVFYLLSFEIIRDELASIFSTIAFSINVWFVRWAGTGMETSLAILLLLWVILFCLRNDYLLSIIVLVLLFHVRPESIFLVPLIFIDHYLNSVDRTRAKHRILFLFIIYCILILPWLIYSLVTFGSVVSNTALAKAGWTVTVDDIAHTTFRSLKILLFSDGIAIFALIVGVIIAIFLRKKMLTQNSYYPEERLYLKRQVVIGISWIFVLLLFYIIADVNIVSRYFLLATPLLVIYAFGALYYIIVRLEKTRYVYVSMLILAVLIMFQSQFVNQRYVRPHIEAFTQGMETCLIPIGKWLNQNTDSSAVIFTPDVGAIGYYSERIICDAAGLISSSIVPYVRKGYTLDQMIEEKLYSSVCQADYVVHRSTVPEALGDNPALTALFYKPFYQMGIGKMEIQYYTVYKVRFTPNLSGSY